MKTIISIKTTFQGILILCPNKPVLKNFLSLSLTRAVSYAPAATSARLLGEARAGYGGTSITRRIGFPQTGYNGRKGIFGSGSASASTSPNTSFNRARVGLYLGGEIKKIATFY